MLIDFTASNFRSIRGAVTLSAVAQKQSVRAGSRRGIKPDEKIGASVPVAGRDFSLLPILGIFGANASGKTSVLSALDTFLTLLARGSESGENSLAGIVPHALATRNEEPTSFEIRCAFDGVIYTYGLSLDGGRVLSEQLDYLPAPPRRNRLLFRRQFDPVTKEYQWRTGEDFEGPHTQLQKQLKPSQPYLSLLARSLNVEVIEPLTEWLTLRLPGIHSGIDATYAQAVQVCFNDDDTRRFIAGFLRDFDTGIDELVVERTEVRAALPHSDGYQAYAIHRTAAGNFRLPLEAESAGTLHLFVLAFRSLWAEVHGTLLLLDEFGAFVHSKATEALVHRFQAPNPYAASAARGQLIFASHDTTLQRAGLLRRDQIWFTQKDRNGATELYPLTDFKPRNDLAVDRAYLDGRFGAVPVIPGNFGSHIAKVPSE